MPKNQPAEFVEPSPANKGITTVGLDTQRTQPSVPIKSAHPRDELGDSGTRMLHGIITEEYIPQLQGIQGIKIFDEMRKSDGTVRAALVACALPVMRAEWFIKPAGDTPEAEAQKDFIEKALFEWLDISFDEFLRQALLMLDFGVMPFEKVYGVRKEAAKDAIPAKDGAEGKPAIPEKEWITLTKLAPRLPKSILQWELEDRTFGIQQIRQDGILAQIPGSKMVIFINQREGDNWWGTSLCRAAYKHWYYKNNFYKIDAIAYERHGVGVPYAMMPPGYTTSDEAKAANTLQNLRANEKAYAIIPDGYDIGFLDMSGGTLRDPQTSIEHHNKEILQSVLAQFLELGATKAASGSRALSTDHSDLFLKSVEAVANNLAATINRQLIPELIDFNFSGTTEYPVIDFAGIVKVDPQAFGTAFAALVTAGAITPTDDDQQYVRGIMGLPARTQEQIDEENANNEEAEEEEDPHEGDVEDESGDDADDAPDQDIDPNGPNDPAKPQAQPNNPKAQSAKNKKTTQAAANKQKPKTSKTGKTPAANSNDKKKASESTMRGTFTPWGKLTAAEQNVDWQKLQDRINAMQDSFTSEAVTALSSAKDGFMKKLHAAIEDDDTKAVAALEMGFVNAYKAIVKKYALQAYDFGKKNVSSDMGLAGYPPDTAASLATIDLMADTIANKVATDLETQAKIAAATAINNDTPTLQAVGAIDKNLDDAIDKSVNMTSSILIPQNLNMGRNDVFQRNLDDIYALQRSEILDAKTCNFCLSVDGRVVDATDPLAQSSIFHSNCRGIWVQIMNDETNPPPIDGIPDNVAQYYGGDVNSLVQPPNAIVKDGTRAAKEVARRAALKK